jgi:TM2 domain-containing membrane protein YozV
VPPHPERAEPSAAAVLGLIPGVGAMYNGQFFKGLIHVVIFAVLVSITDHYGIFGIFIARGCLYQSFEAYHTARALRDGQPLPDPLGLNEVGNWLNLGARQRYPGSPALDRPARANPGSGPNGQGQAHAGLSAALSRAYQDAVHAALPPAPPVPALPGRRVLAVPPFWRRRSRSAPWF